MKSVRQIHQRRHYRVSRPKVIPAGQLNGDFDPIMSAVTNRLSLAFTLQTYTLLNSLIPCIIKIKVNSAQIELHIDFIQLQTGEGRRSFSSKYLLDGILVWKPP